jgi:hypothetical protein
MRRREFVTLLAGAAAAWPLAPRAQQAPKRFGYLASASNPDLQQALLGGLRDLGVEGQNLAIEYRYRANSVGICGWKFALHCPGTRVPYLCFALARISPDQGRTIYLDRSAS